MTEPIIEFSHVWKHYPYYHHLTGGLKHFIFNAPKYLREIKHQKHQALEDISFKIFKGESIAIVGSNGSGKSTTLGMIAGVLRPNKGSVSVRARVSPLLELGGGFHPELTGRENIRLNGVILGLSRKQVLTKMQKIIEFSELNKFIEMPIRTYSSGMLARLAFSVVVHLEPEILLIDEVLAVGDEGFQKKSSEKILEMKKQGVTIILVTHSSADAERLCERTIWIDNHRIRMDGKSSDVIAEYKKKY